ncbi:MAG TPA: SET domain-containing protein [Polyangiaceae bacterium]|jgi:hypothetical protein
MTKARAGERRFSLNVEFRTSAIAGRGVFARQSFDPGQRVVGYAPKQRKLAPSDPLAVVAAATKLTLFSDEQYVIVPDTSVPGGWLCNHSCEPNAAIFSAGDGHIQASRRISPGDEVTVLYGWVTQNEPGRDACRCGVESCRGFINFDISDEEARRVDIVDGALTTRDEALRERLAEYAEYLRSIGQAQVQSTIATTFAAMKRSLGAKIG